MWQFLGFPGGTSGKEPTCQCRRHRRLEFDLWVGKIPGGGNGNPLQYSCLENPMDREAWQATVLGVACQSWLRRLSTYLYGVEIYLKHYSGESGRKNKLKKQKMERGKCERQGHICAFPPAVWSCRCQVHKSYPHCTVTSSSHSDSCRLFPGFLFYLVLLDFLCWNSFRFAAKVSGRYRDFPYSFCPGLSSPTKVVHLLQLMNLHWLIIIIQSP